MPRPPIDFKTRILRISERLAELPGEAAVPISHFKRSANDSWNLLVYFERTLKNTKTRIYESVAERHQVHLSRMVLLSLCASFERFLKELAAVCVDHLANLTADDRFDEFSIKGSALSAHFEADTVGNAICESSTWVSCRQANDRFRRLLQSLDGKKDFFVFPETATHGPDPWRSSVMSTLWQLRHSIAHNDGEVTKSDALKLRLLIGAPLEGAKVFHPTKGYVWYAKLFLDETAEQINERVGKCLADLLTEIHAKDNTLFPPVEAAQTLANDIGVQVTVAGATKAPSS